MTSFEFVFSLFGLMLGLSLVEVVTGFARTMAVRERVRIGWLTPLLGILVMIDLTSFWRAAWRARELIPADFAVLLAALAFTATYYFAAALVFPRQPERWKDLDGHYFRNRRMVLGIVLSANVLQVGLFSLNPTLRADYETLSFALIFVAFVGLLVAGLFVRSAKWSIAILTGLILLYVSVALS